MNINIEVGSNAIKGLLGCRSKCSESLSGYLFLFNMGFSRILKGNTSFDTFFILLGMGRNLPGEH